MTHLQKARHILKIVIEGTHDLAGLLKVEVYCVEFEVLELDADDEEFGFGARDFDDKLCGLKICLLRQILIILVQQMKLCLSDRQNSVKIILRVLQVRYVTAVLHQAQLLPEYLPLQRHVSC